MLNNFEPSFNKLIANEGLYANIKGDGGGETIFGISRVNFPNWEGWQILDKIKFRGVSTKFINNSIKNNHELLNLVQTFYYQNFWQKIQGNSLPTPIDFLVFDFAVNAGVSAGIKVFQRALGLDDDGFIGVATKEAISNINPKNQKQVIYALKARIKAYYNSLNQSKFIKGWLARVDNNFKGLV